MKQANSLHCFVCGVANPFGLHLRFYESPPGEVTAEYTVPDEYQGYPGIVHGGVVAAMLDEISGRSLMGGDPPRFMFTARLDIRYRRNVPVGAPLRLVGHAGPRKGRTATATSEIYSMEGTLLAQAEALMIDVPEEVVQSTDLEALGWKIYPENDGHEA
jgi:acyl-coenzyme A thioesterase PaaI-like protein